MDGTRVRKPVARALFHGRIVLATVSIRSRFPAGQTSDERRDVLGLEWLGDVRLVAGRKRGQAIGRRGVGRERDGRRETAS